MKIAIITQSVDLWENKRLYKAAVEMGHECKIIDVADIILELGGNEHGAYFEGDNLTEYDIVIARSIFTVKKRALSIIKYLRSQKVRVMDNNLEKVGYNIDKVQDNLSFFVNDLPIPRTIHVDDEEDFTESCSEIGFPVVVKHVGSGKGNGVYKFDDESEVEAFLDNLKEKERVVRSYIVQEFIPYIQDLRILIIGNKIVGAMQRTPKDGEFRANFSRGGSVKMVEIDDDTKALALKAAEVTQSVDGGVDIIITQDGKKYLLEVNRTPGFEGFEKASGQDIAKLIIEESIESAY